MHGRAEVWRLRSRLEATFKRVELIDADPELQSDFAKYLCVLVSGFVETAVAELLVEHSRRNGSASLQRYVEAQTERLTNLNTERLRQVLSSFDADWGKQVQRFVVDERKDAFDSVLGLRNTIVHGGSVGLTYRRISDYYERIKPIVDLVADLCAPPAQ